MGLVQRGYGLQVLLILSSGFSAHLHDLLPEVRVFLSERFVFSARLGGLVPHFGGRLAQVVLELVARLHTLVEELLVRVEVALEVVEDKQFVVEAEQGVLQMLVFILEVLALAHPLFC